MKIKWIIGYVDGYGAVHHKVVNIGDMADSHNQVWPGPKHTKWRWMPNAPNALNTYGNDLNPEDEDAVWSVIEKNR